MKVLMSFLFTEIKTIDDMLLWMINCLSSMIKFLVIQEYMVLLKKHMLNSGIVIKVKIYVKKGIMNLSFKTLLLEMTGKQPQNYTLDKSA